MPESPSCPEGSATTEPGPPSRRGRWKAWLRGKAHRLLEYLEAPVPKRPVWQRMVLPFVGVLLLALSVVGGLLPILQGWLFVIPGAVLLACVHPRCERLVRGWCATFLRPVVRRLDRHG